MPMTRSVKARLQFPFGRIRRYLKEGRYSKRVGRGAPVYLAAVLEYLAAELLEIAGNSAKDNKKSRITPRHVMIAIRGDGVTIPEGGVVPYIHAALTRKNTAEKAAASAKKSDESPEL